MRKFHLQIIFFIVPFISHSQSLMAPFPDSGLFWSIAADNHSDTNFTNQTFTYYSQNEAARLRPNCFGSKPYDKQSNQVDSSVSFRIIFENDSTLDRDTSYLPAIYVEWCNCWYSPRELPLLKAPDYGFSYTVIASFISPDSIAACEEDAVYYLEPHSNDIVEEALLVNIEQWGTFITFKEAPVLEYYGQNEFPYQFVLKTNLECQTSTPLDSAGNLILENIQFKLSYTEGNTPDGGRSYDTTIYQDAVPSVWFSSDSAQFLSWVTDSNILIPEGDFDSLYVTVDSNTTSACKDDILAIALNHSVGDRIRKSEKYVHSFYEKSECYNIKGQSNSLRPRYIRYSKDIRKTLF